MKRRPLLERFAEKVESNPTWDQCWVWLAGKNQYGYGLVNHKGSRLAHRIAWEIATGAAPELCVLHSCDNRVCVNPAHLFLGTRTDNANDRDKKKRGIMPPPKAGEAHPMAKLTEANVTEIRRLRERGQRLVVIASRFGVSVCTIHEIATKKTWGHVA